METLTALGLDESARRQPEDRALLETLRAADRPQLIYFESSSCLTCSLVAPQVDALEARLEGVDVRRLSLDDYPLTAAALHVIAAPAVICLLDGERYIVRTSPKEEIVDKVTGLFHC